ncbi:MAG: hypothetical protein WDN46_10295 [Methylocella sp.]
MPPAIIRPNTCSTCGYKQTTQAMFHCHRQPPAVLPMVAPGPRNRPTVIAHVTSWPVVNETDWCGEWKSPSAVVRPPAEMQEAIGQAPRVMLGGSH